MILPRANICSGNLLAGRRMVGSMPSASRLANTRGQSASVHTFRSRLLLSRNSSTKHFTQAYSTLQTGEGSRVSTIFTGLILVGVCVTSYGLYEFYSTFTTWPKELRGDLRSAVKADHQGDFKISEAYFRRALEKAQTLSSEQLGGQRHLKVSGIAIALAAVLEKQNNLHGAYETYAHAFADIIRAPSPSPASVLSGPERMRAVGLSAKLAELASRFGQIEEEERYLVFGVEEVLRMGKEGSEAALAINNNTEEIVESKQELALPIWVSHTDAGSVLERLAEFYSRTGKPDYAIPLYLQALSILLPPSKSTNRTPTITDRCRGALLMNNLAEVFATPTSSRKADLEQATAWAKKGLAVAQKARGEIVPSSSKNSSDVDSIPICESVLAVLVYNIGMLSEKKDDTKGAQAFFKQALHQSAAAGFEEGKVEAEKAIARTSKN